MQVELKDRALADANAELQAAALQVQDKQQDLENNAGGAVHVCLL